MAKWSTGSESGILRKPTPKDKFDDLLVFGYACKIFRDDEKALFIDQGKHLIPWMGDTTLKIDRYDCRGALSELAPYEGSDGDSSRWFGLKESDRRLELLCDEERYYALKYNEEELEMYQEEETKRLLQKGTQFQYNYDVPRNPDEPIEGNTNVLEQDETFVPPVGLNIPADMEVPKTVKENARIEKTALFVSNQGPQMEILIKTKQADNPQFFFMNKEHPLNKYYKHVLTAIKSGQYKTQPEETTIEQKSEDPIEQEEHDGDYLHPSLLATPTQPAQPPPPPLPTVPYKPSADCTYSQLVSRIQGTQSESATPPPPLPSQESPQGQMSYEQQQYYQQYYYAAQYYEYYKQVAQQFAGQNADPTQANAFQDAGITPEQFYAVCQKQAELQNILQSHAVYQQYVQEPTNPYAQLVSNLSQTQDAVLSATNINDISKAPILYTKVETELEHDTQPSLPIIGPQLPTVIQEQVPEVTKTQDSGTKMPLLSLAQYGSDSEEESDEDEENGIKIPPNDLQQIIDKMAVYVSKNGKDFESIVKAKGDTRFEFLNHGHEFNPYYKMKLSENTNITQDNGITEKPKEKKVVAPVSFSIKKPKDDTPKEIKSALPLEESDEEEESDTIAKTPPPTVPPVETVQPVSLTPPLKETPISPVPAPLVENGQDETIPEEIDDTITKKLEPENLILEMIDITDDLEERRENKRVENIKKDKITAVVKERIALQLERKKKAAAFLKLKTNTAIETNVKQEKTKESSITNLKPSNNHEAKSIKHVKVDKINKIKTNIDNKPMETESIKKTEPANEIEIINIEDSDLEEGEIKKHKKSSKKKKSHKRKRSKSKHESKKCRHRHKSKEHKKSKKRRKRSEVSDSDSSSVVSA